MTAPLNHDWSLIATAEAVGVPRKTIDDWTDDFGEMSGSDISPFPPGFETKGWRLI
jgi:hypothetical protein